MASRTQLALTDAAGMAWMSLGYDKQGVATFLAGLGVATQAGQAAVPPGTFVVEEWHFEQLVSGEFVRVARLPVKGYANL